MKNKIILVILFLFVVYAGIMSSKKVNDFLDNQNESLFSYLMGNRTLTDEELEQFKQDYIYDESDTSSNVTYDCYVNDDGDLVINQYTTGDLDSESSSSYSEYIANQLLTINETLEEQIESLYGKEVNIIFTQYNNGNLMIQVANGKVVENNLG